MVFLQSSSDFMFFLLLNYNHFLAMASLDCKVYCTIIPRDNMHVLSIAIKYCSQGVCVPHLVMLHYVNIIDPVDNSATLYYDSLDKISVTFELILWLTC